MKTVKSKNYLNHPEAKEYLLKKEKGIRQRRAIDHLDYLSDLSVDTGNKYGKAVWSLDELDSFGDKN
jgi:hypothetical protein